MNEGTHNSDDESNSTASTGSNEDRPRRTRKMTSRLAKKSTGVSVPVRKKMQPVTRRQVAMANKSKYGANYNVTKEKRKQEKKLQVRKLYGCINDSRGYHINTNTDMCDCLDLSCPGCFFSCKKCGNKKCGVECRVNRKNKYESIEYHGYNMVKKNPLEK